MVHRHGPASVSPWPLLSRCRSPLSQRSPDADVLGDRQHVNVIHDKVSCKSQKRTRRWMHPDELVAPCRAEHNSAPLSESTSKRVARLFQTDITPSAKASGRHFKSSYIRKRRRYRRPPLRPTVVVFTCCTPREDPTSVPLTSFLRICPANRLSHALLRHARNGRTVQCEYCHRMALSEDNYQ